MNENIIHACDGQIVRAGRATRAVQMYNIVLRRCLDEPVHAVECDLGCAVNSPGLARSRPWSAGTRRPGRKTSPGSWTDRRSKWRALSIVMKRAPPRRPRTPPPAATRAAERQPSIEVPWNPARLCASCPPISIQVGAGATHAPVPARPRSRPRYQPQLQSHSPETLRIDNYFWSPI
jgi:hypothetical protein